MLSEQRVMHMTKMAMIEDKQGRKLGPAIHYANVIIFLFVPWAVSFWVL